MDKKIDFNLNFKANTSKLKKLHNTLKSFTKKSVEGVVRATKAVTMLSGVANSLPKIAKTKFVADVKQLDSTYARINKMRLKAKKGDLNYQKLSMEQKHLYSQMGLTGKSQEEQHKILKKQQLAVDKQIRKTESKTTQENKKQTVESKKQVQSETNLLKKKKKGSKEDKKALSSEKKVTKEKRKQTQKQDQQNKKQKKSNMLLKKFSSRVQFVLTAMLSYAVVYKIQEVMRALVTNTIEFEDKMSTVYTLLDKSSDATKEMLSKEVMNSMTKFGEDMETATRALYDILSARVPVDWAGYVLEESMKGAVAGFTNAKVAGDAITTTLNSFNLEAKEAGDVSDWLFQIIKYGKTTMEELQPNLGKVTASANLLNFSMEEVGAALSTMTQSGIKTDVAITSLRQLMITLAQPTEKAKRIFDKYGIALDLNTIRQQGFAETVKKLTGLTEEEIVVLAKSRRGFQALATAMGQNEKYQQNYNNMLNRSGVAQKAFNERASTLKFQLKKIRQAWVELSLEISKNFLPIVKILSGFVELQIEALSTVPGKIALAAAAVGTLTIAIYGLTVAMKSLMANIPIFGWIALGISAVLDGALILYQALKKTKNVADSTIEDINKRIERSQEIVKEQSLEQISNLEMLEARYNRLSKIVNKNEVEQDKYNKTISDLIAIAPDHLTILEDEETSAKNIAEAFKDAKEALTSYFEVQALEARMKTLYQERLRLMVEIDDKADEINNKKRKNSELNSEITEKYKKETLESLKILSTETRFLTLEEVKSLYEDIGLSEDKVIEKSKYWSDLMESGETFTATTMLKDDIKEITSTIKKNNDIIEKSEEKKLILENALAMVRKKILKYEEQYNKIRDKGDSDKLIEEIKLKEKAQEEAKILYEKEVLYDEETGKYKKKTHLEKMKDARAYALASKEYMDVLRKAQGKLTDGQKENLMYGQEVRTAYKTYHELLQKISKEEIKDAETFIGYLKTRIELGAKESKTLEDRANIYNILSKAVEEQILLKQKELENNELLSKNDKERLELEIYKLKQERNQLKIKSAELFITKLKREIELEEEQTNVNEKRVKQLKRILLIQYKNLLLMDLDADKIHEIKMAIAGLQKEVDETENINWLDVLGIKQFKKVEDAYKYVFGKIQDVAKEAFDAILEHQLKVIEAAKEAELESLAERYEGYQNTADQTILTEAQRSSVMTSLKEKEEQEKEEIEKKYNERLAKQKKRNARYGATINFAEATIALLASTVGEHGTLGWIEFAILEALMAGVFATQMAIIDKTEYAKGGFIEGQPHSQGGVPFTVAGRPGFEAEGGEFMFQKGAVKDNLPILGWMNEQLAKGKSFGEFALDYLGGKTKNLLIPQAQTKFATGGAVPNVNTAIDLSEQNAILEESNHTLSELKNVNKKTLKILDRIRRKGESF